MHTKCIGKVFAVIEVEVVEVVEVVAVVKGGTIMGAQMEESIVVKGGAQVEEIAVVKGGADVEGHILKEMIAINKRVDESCWRGV